MAPWRFAGTLNSLTELSDSLKNMLRGPDFMTKFIYPGSEKTPNRVVFFFFFPPRPCTRYEALVCQASEVFINFYRFQLKQKYLI